MRQAGQWYRRWLLLVAGSLFLGVPAASAEEIEWRTDYRKARQGAADKDRPLVVDVGTEQCYWGKQLDQRTFQDPAVVALLNERFIPLRVNDQVAPELAQALRIQSYPTIVLANAEGKILGYQEGFVEAPRVKERLQRAIGLGSPPERMTVDYDAA